jgi:hypothetical protein
MENKAKPFDNETILKALVEKFGQAFDNRSTNPRFGIFGAGCQGKCTKT